MLSVSGLTRRFGTRVAVEDLSFALAPGEIFALLGPNGAGKTTTLRMLGGLIAASSGTVQVHGETLSPANASRLRSRIGFLTEAPGLWDRLTVRQNLLVYARLQGLGDPRRAVDAALDLFEIRGRQDDPTAQLSKGLKQRVALARTLLHSPDIVLLDEPTAGLDPASARDLRDTMVRLRDERRAILVSTHNLDEVERLADRVAVLRGRLVALDTPAALRSRLFGSRVRMTFAGPARPWMNVLAETGVHDAIIDGDTVSIGLDGTRASVPLIVRRLAGAGADILAVVPEHPPLEEVYLRLLDEPRPPFRRTMP